MKMCHRFELDKEKKSSQQEIEGLDKNGRKVNGEDQVFFCSILSLNVVLKCFQTYSKSKTIFSKEKKNPLKQLDNNTFLGV